MAGLKTSIMAPEMTFAGRNCTLVVDRPYIVGILNVTPDSFSDGGQFLSLDQAVLHGLKMVEEGADIIDIGGESTRPGSMQISEQEEMDRVAPVIERLKKEVSIPLSIDTTKSSVAKTAVSCGADFVNDISGLTFDAEMAQVVSKTGAGLIVMHTRGRPNKMQQDTAYADVFSEVFNSLKKSILNAEKAGIPLSKIAVDPGVGFGKNVYGNLEILRRTADFLDLGRPVMLGTSRKSFIGKVLDKPQTSDRLAGHLASIALGFAGGARLFRVHDVAASKEAVRMAQAICAGADWTIN